MNQKIRKLENDLMMLLNSSDLPEEVKRIILGKLEAQMTALSNQAIILEESRSHAESV